MACLHFAGPSSHLQSPGSNHAADWPWGRNLHSQIFTRWAVCCFCWLWSDHSYVLSQWEWFLYSYYCHLVLYIVLSYTNSDIDIDTGMQWIVGAQLLLFWVHFCTRTSEMVLLISQRLRESAYPVIGLLCLCFVKARIPPSERVKNTGT